MNIAVIGGGSWATALVKLLTDNATDKKITWWMRNAEQMAHIQKYGHNANYLSSVYFDPKKIHFESDLKTALYENDISIFAVPSAFLHDTLIPVHQDFIPNKIFVSAVKGIIPQTHQLANEFFEWCFGVNGQQCVAITGPCHAEEVAQEKLSYLTISSGEKSHAEKVASLLQTRYLKTHSNADIEGTEYAAVLKNIYALNAGICHGLGYGDNFHAVLVSAAIREMEAILHCICENNRDVNESAYLGDLLVTAYSLYSRNRTFGTMIGKGYSVKMAQLEMNMVAEGYYATKSMIEVLKNTNKSFPILQATYEILYEHLPASKVIQTMSEKLY